LRAEPRVQALENEWQSRGSSALWAKGQKKKDNGMLKNVIVLIHIAQL